MSTYSSGTNVGSAANGSSEGSGVKEKAAEAKDKATDVAQQATQQSQEAAQNATEQAKQVAGQATDNAKEVAGHAKEQASQLAQQATEQMKTMFGDASSQMKDHASTEAQKAGFAIRGLSDQLQALAEGRTEDAGDAGDWARQAAEKLSSFAQKLDSDGIDGVASELSNFARTKPETFLLLAGAGGFLAGRMLRGSQAAQQDQESSGYSGRQGSYTGPQGSGFAEEPLVRQPYAEGGIYGEEGGTL